MSRTKIRVSIDGSNSITFTAQQEATRDAEEALVATNKPMDDWKAAMEKLDCVRTLENGDDIPNNIPRWFEDYITENPVTLAPGRAKDSYDAKVALRATKP